MYNKTLIHYHDTYGRDIGYTIDGTRTLIKEYDATTNSYFPYTSEIAIQRDPTTGNITRTFLNEAEGLSFRTRIRVDDKGNLISALYGKI